MAYVRKTTDEYRIMWLGYLGWEEVVSEDNIREAKQRLREYQENIPGAYRIEKHRIKGDVIR